MKKTAIYTFTFLIVLVLDVVFILNIINKDSILKQSITLLNSQVYEISSFFNKYHISNKGVLDVDVNYRGAHGENYPSKFTFNFELADKLYFEDSLYADINVDKKMLNLFSKLSKLNDFDINKCSNIKRTKKGYQISCDSIYINNLLNTNFKNINITIYTKGIVKEIEYLVINLDDIKITLKNNELIVDYFDNNIKVVFNESNYYVNINDLLKANILITDVYSCSVVLNDKVYYLEVRNDGLYIKFTSQAAIYNNINILVKYQDVKINKDKKIENNTDNPIVNYLLNSDLNFWR